MHDQSGDCSHVETCSRHQAPTSPEPARATRLPIASSVEPKPADNPADLRRRKVRAFSELLVQRAVWLPPSDRVLVEAVYRDDQPVAELARLLEVDARSLRRRLRRLVHRLLSQQFVRVASELSRPAARRSIGPAESTPAVNQPATETRHASSWSDHRRKVAEECILNGRSIREASRALHLSVHMVRRHREALQIVLATDAVGGRP
ncbi:MAG: hypothetical protein GIKADHBN_02732 [Phycisphaerales bacterium]|nr:hypothetical protein [Phycisphaerales bacterium]